MVIESMKGEVLDGLCKHDQTPWLFIGCKIKKKKKCVMRVCREPVRHSTRDKGHEEGGSAYAKAGSSLRSPPGYS